MAVREAERPHTSTSFEDPRAVSLSVGTILPLGFDSLDSPGVARVFHRLVAERVADT